MTESELSASIRDLRQWRKKHLSKMLFRIDFEANAEVLNL